MKQLKSNAAILLVTAVIFAIPSCKKDKGMSMTEKNIDYPAVYKLVFFVAEN